MTDDAKLRPSSHLKFLGSSLLLLGCGDTTPVSPPQTLPAPQVTLTATPANVEYGGRLVLDWTITGAMASCQKSWDSSPVAPPQDVVFPTEPTVFRLTCANSDGTAEASVTVGVGPVPALGQRTVGDRPDEIVGSVIHVIYAMQADNLDRRFDVDGILDTSMKTAQTWLARQTGGRQLRLDTYGGELDVMFVAYPEGEGIARVTEAENRIIEQGKLALVVHDGPPAALNFRHCGLAIPTRSLVNSGAGCPGPSLPSRLGQFETIVLHELFHSFGAVASGAPNHCGGSHVCDDTQDLMNNFALPGQPVLDFGRDDYYNEAALRPDLSNTAFSSFLDPPINGVSGSR